MAPVSSRRSSRRRPAVSDTQYGEHLAVHDILLNAVPYKMEAADYHLKQMRRAFESGLLMPKAPELNDQRQKQANDGKFKRLCWHYEAFLFQLYAAFDHVLQELNVRGKLGLDFEDVTWNAVRKAMPEHPVVVHLKAVREEPWFRLLRNARHRSAHHLIPLFAMIGNSTGTAQAVAYDHPETRGVGGPELFATLDGWWTSAREALLEAHRIMRDSSAGSSP